MCFFCLRCLFLFWLGPDLVVSFLADGLPGCASFVPLLHMLILLVAASDLYFATEFRHKLVFSHLIWFRALSFSCAGCTPPILRASLRGVFVAVLSNCEYQVFELHSVPPLV